MNRLVLRERLRFLLDLAGHAYADYQAAGKRYCDAVRIYEANTRIESLLLEDGNRFPSQHWPHVAALLRHLQIWRVNWEATRAHQRPSPEDLFAFANTVTFPRVAAAALCDEGTQTTRGSSCMSDHAADTRVAKTLIIAEAGVNHNGDIDMALRLIDAAANAGADLVKFQTFSAEALASVNAPKAEYQIRNEGAAPGGKSDSQVEMLRRLQLPVEGYETLMSHCAERGIGFFSTAFDLDSLDYLRTLGLEQFKVPSGEITNLPYLRKVAGFGCDLILSTGMATLGEIEAAIDVIEEAGLPRERVTVLHCTTEYPAPIDEVNLRAMGSIGTAFGVPVGYSDHTTGIDVALAAVALGARVIEKHFTLDRGLPGPDHAASLEPEELAAMVRGIRKVEAALGSAQKRRTPSEASNVAIARKSIVAARSIREGEILSDENLTAKRPGTGLSPMRWGEVIGREATRDFAADEEIEL